MAPSFDSVAGRAVVMEVGTKAVRAWLRCQVFVWTPELLDDIAESMRWLDA